MAAIKMEEKREKERGIKLSHTYNEYDRKYLEKLYGMERAKARARLDRIKVNYDNKISNLMQQH